MLAREVPTGSWIASLIVLVAISKSPYTLTTSTSKGLIVDQLLKDKKVVDPLLISPLLVVVMSGQVVGYREPTPRLMKRRVQSTPGAIQEKRFFPSSRFSCAPGVKDWTVVLWPLLAMDQFIKEQVLPAWRRHMVVPGEPVPDPWWVRRAPLTRRLTTYLSLQRDVWWAELSSTEWRLHETAFLGEKHRDNSLEH